MVCVIMNVLIIDSSLIDSFKEILGGIMTAWAARRAASDVL